MVKNLINLICLLPSLLLAEPIYYDFFPNNYTSYRNIITSVENENHFLSFETPNKIPTWLKGEAFHAGPGKFEWGDETYKNLIDGSTMVQKFTIDASKIEGNQIKYERKFLETTTYLANKEADKIVYSEVGTYGEPEDLLDGLKPWNKLEIGQRRLEYFAINQTDNTDVKMHYVDGDLWSFSEYPAINVIDKMNFRIKKRIDIRDYQPENDKNLLITTQTAHGFVDENGDFYNSVTGFELTKDRIFAPVHYVYKLTDVGTKDLVENDEEIGSDAEDQDRLNQIFENIKWSEKIEIPARPGQAGYFHDPAHTENYFIMPFQSIEVDILRAPIEIANGRPIGENGMRVNSERDGIFVVVSKKTMQEVGRFKLPYFISGHTINAFEVAEKEGVIHYDCFRTFKNFFDLAKIEYSNVTGPELMENTFQYGPENRAWRIVMDLNLPNAKNKENPAEVDAYELFPENLPENDNDDWLSYNIQGIEFPRVADQNVEKEYQNFYAVGTGSLVPGDRVYKSDIVNKIRKVWMEPGFMVTETMIASRPKNFKTTENSETSYDNVESVIGIYATPFSDQDTHLRPFYAILDAETMQELGRAYFPEGTRLVCAFHMTWIPAIEVEKKSPNEDDTTTTQSTPVDFSTTVPEKVTSSAASDAEITTLKPEYDEKSSSRSLSLGILTIIAAFLIIA